MVNREQTIAQIKAGLGSHLLHIEPKSDKRLFLEIAPEHISDCTYLMLNGLQARFQIASGVDTPTAIEVLYHWALDQLGYVITVRTRLNRDQPAIASIAPQCPAAEWIEREMWEMLGIQFKNHPDLRHLLLGADWPEGKYPLRRDYQR
jgi:Ni,Fe-hydrogenase III component G